MVTEEDLASEPTVIELSKKSWLESFQDNPFMGFTLQGLVRTLYPLRNEIDYKVFAPRLAMLFLFSILNSIFAMFESVLFSRVVKRTKIPKKPLIIVGHPRSGTTLLHNLLSLDDRFFAPNVFQVGFAPSFLTMERFAQYWPFNALLSSKRPMDEVKLAWGEPCEDELATNVLSNGASQYMMMGFLRSHMRFLPYTTFKDPKVSDKLEQWRDGFFHFLRKLTYRMQTSEPGNERRLVLKSPIHMSRVALLDALFEGDVQFIHIHRHPYSLFQSQYHALVERYYQPCTALQTFTAKHAQDFLITQGVVFERAFCEDMAKLGPGRIAHLFYDDLARDMNGTLKKAYADLGIPFTPEVEHKFNNHQSETRLYSPNKFQPLSNDAKQLIGKYWHMMFRYGYET